MTVLIDTPIWSLFLRRKAADLSLEQDRLKRELEALIRQNRAQIIGPIRQEVLSGISDELRFRTVRDYLRGFDDVRIETRDYEHAASISNRCRTAGIAGSPIDFLICAVAFRQQWRVFTLDKDFGHHAPHAGITLYAPGGSPRI